MLTSAIVQLAKELGADAVGVSKLGAVDPLHAQMLEEWLKAGHNAEMSYLERNHDLRLNPGDAILAGARSVIVVAASYYPLEQQHPDAPKISRYAFGEDYHLVLTRMLNRLGEMIHNDLAPHGYRAIVDTVPFMERYWAEKAGLGFIGRNRNLIIPKTGSYIFLGELLTTLDLTPTDSLISDKIGCGLCHRCWDACPTKALGVSGLDARKCISYLTIEYKGEIPFHLAEKMGKNLYGCDICQEVCPYNRRPSPQRLFPPAPRILSLRREDIVDLSPEKYRSLVKGSAMGRAKYTAFLRNANIYLHNNPPSSDDV